MKSYDVLQQLYATIPELTDKFSDSIGIASIQAVDSTEIHVITDSDHDLKTGSHVNISGIDYNTPIVSISRSGEAAIVITSEDNDLTEGYQESVVISGASEPQFNGSFKLLSVQNRTTFIVSVEDSGAENSVGGGLKESTGYNVGLINGVKEITVLSENSFSYEIDSALTFYETNSGLATIGYRMATAIRGDDVLDMYTRQELSDYWLFVVVGAVSASKDRKNNSDAIYVFNAESGYKQETVHTLEIYVVANSSDSVAGRKIRDSMEDVATALIKSLCGKRISNGNSSGDYYSIVFDSHLTAYYDRAVYIHGFNFQSTGQIGDEDINHQTDSVAMRDAFVESDYVTSRIG